MKTYRFTLKRELLHDGEPVKIHKAKEAAAYIAKNVFPEGELFRESCYILTLNANHEVTGVSLLSLGGTSSTDIDVKIACKTAIEAMARGVILTHNHPSGNTRPSKGDIEQTQRLKKALGIFDIDLLDHIILTEKEYFSFADETTAKIPA
jgi:DNA repair protein RadC